jgi:hypothetical protein
VARRDWYKSNGIIQSLVTTDDLDGIRHEVISEVIEDLREGNPKTTEHSAFSEHHYKLSG